MSKQKYFKGDVVEYLHRKPWGEDTLVGYVHDYSEHLDAYIVSCDKNDSFCSSRVNCEDIKKKFVDFQ